MISLGITYLLVYVCLVTVYKTMLKTFKEKLIVLFWTTLFLYFGYLGYAFIIENVFTTHSHPFKEILFKYTFVNVPFYMGIALCMVMMYVVFARLLQDFELSSVVPIMRIKMLITTAGYLLLGQTFHLHSFLGVITTFIGAIVSVWPSPTPKSFAELKKRFPVKLIMLATAAAFLFSLAKIFVYMVIQRTPITEQLQQFMDHIFSPMHSLTLTFVHPLEYNIGVRFFITLFFVVYIVNFKGLGAETIRVLRQHFCKIMIISGVFLAQIIFYYSAYGLIEDKVLISPVAKLSLPLILITSYFVLDEKITRQKVIGYGIIIIGSLLALL